MISTVTVDVVEGEPKHPETYTGTYIEELLVVLISGDGDYKMLVDFLIEQNKFEKILVTSYSVDVGNRRYYERVRSRSDSRPL
jgi:hypothetical protein